MNYDTSFVSETGGRKVNEDTYGYQIAPSGGCWVVADGLGGASGRTASLLFSLYFPLSI
jgi:serine/threonine protein phosphatase PrpC